MRTINLCQGAGDGIKTGCLITASNILIGRPEDLDVNSCVCVLIHAFGIMTNDAMPADVRRELYTSMVWEILGTKTWDKDVLWQRVAECRRWLEVMDSEMANGHDGLSAIDWAKRLASAVIYRKRWWVCPQIIRDIAAIGDRRPVETVITAAQLREQQSPQRLAT